MNEASSVTLLRFDPLASHATVGASITRFAIIAAEFQRARSIAMRILKLGLLLCLCYLLVACFSASYLWQAGRGQFKLLRLAKPLPQVIADLQTPPRIKTLLTEMPRIKRYAVTHYLTPTQNYQDYVAWDKPMVTWLVTASRPLAFKVKTWRFPLVGSFPYLGWFEPLAAIRHAQQLSQGGWDVYVRGATAYSTLGWFRDPLISTMFTPDPAARGVLVNTILHESVHATYFIKGQGTFNESLANFIADNMAEDYLKQHASRRETITYRQLMARQIIIRQRFHQAYLYLQRVYGSPRSDSEKLKIKNQYLQKLRLRLHWSEAINNATLVQFSVYNAGSPAFSSLLRVCHGDWVCFWRHVRRITSKSFSRPEQQDITAMIRSIY